MMKQDIQVCGYSARVGVGQAIIGGEERVGRLCRAGGRRESGVGRIEDETLMEKIAATGDGSAVSELYDRYGALVYGMGMRYLGDRGFAEDLTQDVFLSVWRNAASFDPSRASFATWLYRIARNRATDVVRRRKARVRTVDGESFPMVGEQDHAGLVSRNFDLNAALYKLSPIHREVLNLAYMEGLSQREIAHRTKTPLGTVKSRTTAALRVLRERMNHDEEQYNRDE